MSPVGMSSLTLIMVLAFLPWGMASGFPSSIAHQTSVEHFSEASPLSSLSMVASRPPEHVPVPWGSMLTRWSLWLRMVLSTKGDRPSASSLKSRLSMPYLLRSPTDTGNEMVDIPELLELYRDEGITHPWPILNLSRCFLLLSLFLHSILILLFAEPYACIDIYHFWDRAVCNENGALWFRCLLNLGHVL